MRRSGVLVRLAAGVAAAAVLLVAGSPRTVTVHEAPAAAASMSSPNWAGYAAHGPGTQFTDVRGAWVQPGIACPQGGTYSSFWIGLDGYLSNYVEQVGTGADCSAQNQPVYYAWYELYPAERVRIAIVVHPGDHLEAAVGAVPGGTSLSLRDVTTGRTFSTTRQGPTGPLNSAEWIAEAPSSCGAAGCSVLPLADFATVWFTGCSATAGGSNGTITSAAWSADVITMVRSNGQVLAQPTQLSPDGAGFDVHHR